MFDCLRRGLVVIRHTSVAPLGLRYRGFPRFYKPSWISIAVAIRSLDPTLGL